MPGCGARPGTHQREVVRYSSHVHRYRVQPRAQERRRNRSVVKNFSFLNSVYVFVLGDILRQPSSTESLFPIRMLYDMMFFFVVIIIVLNLIFGVIIDTFADLRSEKQNKEEVIKNSCFICGLERKESFSLINSHSSNLVGL